MFATLKGFVSNPLVLLDLFLKPRRLYVDISFVSAQIRQRGRRSQYRNDSQGDASVGIASEDPALLRAVSFLSSNEMLDFDKISPTNLISFLRSQVLLVPSLHREHDVRNLVRRVWKPEGRSLDLLSRPSPSRTDT